MPAPTSLRDCLTRIQSLEDLPDLIRALGHDPVWRELPGSQWKAYGLMGAAAVVGRWGDFWWYGTLTRDPERAARRLGRGLYAMGELGGVLALDLAGRRLACGAAFGRVPVRVMGLAEVAPLDLARLERIRGGTDSAFGTAARLADALSSEDIGDRFFRRFREVLAAFRGAMPDRMPSAQRHEAALLQLTRVLFLYFVQSKGWLDGRTDFLASEIDGCLSSRHPLHRSLLEPLFFGTLNRPIDSRTERVRRFGAIPFLNGGLFEPHALEKRWRITLPDSIWRVAFSDLFEHFHFTPRHGAGGEAIDPEMLGRVFESVMDPEVRRATGTFYTPRALVESVLEEGLVAVLSSRLRLSDPEARRQLSQPDARARSILDRITILDPAVGSGAFLVAALDRLAELPLRTGTRAARRRHVLQHSLFGVDLNPSAVRLAELRLWLELLAAEESETPTRVEPLPNLDGLIRQGDSLVDPLGVPVLRWITSDHARRVAAARISLVAAQGSAKRPALQTLQRTEAEALAAALDRALASVADRLADLTALRKETTLFGEPRKLNLEQRRALRDLLDERRRLKSLRRRVQETGAMPWFHYPIHFADVFARGGFDLVVGNPPWVRAEQLPPSLRLHLAERYRWWRPGGGPRRPGFGHQPDLAVAFLERATALAGSGGSIAFLLPAKVATAGYAATAREALARTTTIRAAANLLDDPRAVFEATVYPYALVTTVSNPPSDHRFRTALGPTADTTPQAYLGRAPWVIVPDHIHATRTRLLEDYPHLSAAFAIHLGVKTGLNRVFLDPPTACVDEEHILPAIRGRDVHPFATRPGCRLLWPHDPRGRVLQRLRARTTTYLTPHAEALRRRRDWKGGPWWSLFRTAPAARDHIVVWADLARTLRAIALDRRGSRAPVPLNTCYLAPTGDAETALRLAAWLNAPTIQALARLGADAAATGFRRFNARTVGGLPWPPDAARSLPLLTIGGETGDAPDHAERLDVIIGDLLGIREEERRALCSIAD